MAAQTYLVLSATGRQGRAVVKALAAKGEAIVVSSRDPESSACKALLEIEQVGKAVRADFNDPDSIVAAIKESGATRVWFTTDFWGIPWLRRTRATEAKLGANVIDAIAAAKADGCDGIEHVVYSSVGDADGVPETVGHFWGKADVEKYMASKFGEGSGVTWSVIRPVAFFENVDDPANFNPLTKGGLKFLTYPDKKVKFIACEDIGKGSAALLTDPAAHAGKTIEAAGGEHTGLELTEALSEASGTPCTFAMAMPRFALWLFFGDLYHMVTWIESTGYSADIGEFKKLVPDAQDAKGFFEAMGQWANGEKFETKK